MSFLYPLFLVGTAAVAFPIVLHLIRRHTRKRVVFSSLMFLRPTMPRFSKRSRLEHLPLLLLRCIVLCLLALAFARPFFRRPIAPEPARPGERIAVLIDTSASMRRADMWTQALAEARSVLDEVSPADRVCIMGFDRTARTLMGFEQWRATDPSRRVPAVEQILSELSPSWASTDLGGALVAAAEAIEDDEINDVEEAPGPCRIVLISDLQSGSELEALVAYEWPHRTLLVVKLISDRTPTNASLHLMADDERRRPEDQADLRVRVANSPLADREHFQLSWSQPPGAVSVRPVDVYVAPGESVVLAPPARAEPSVPGQLMLTGDDHDFDNRLYVAPHVGQEVRILYIGQDDPNDPADMLYYVRRAFEAEASGSYRVVRRSSAEPLVLAEVEAAHLTMVTEPIGPQNIETLRAALRTGRTIMLITKSPAVVGTLSALAGVDTFQLHEANVDQYAMLGQIRLDHPLLAAFSDPRFGDFRRIHFWKYRRLHVADEETIRVLARFDNNDAAWLQIAVGEGSLVVWTCGWHPSDSDLALSSKFVPLLYSVLEQAAALPSRQSQYYVGDAVPLPTGPDPESADVHIRKPDASVARPVGDSDWFNQTDLPGLYTVVSSAGERSFAINLSGAECRTDPMAVEVLEQLGVSLDPASEAPAVPVVRPSDRAGFVDMESEQKLWRWVLVAVLVVLLIEIWLGGVLTRSGPASQEP